MIWASGRPTFVSEAIFVDEIGIETGVYGAYRLKSSYQPIFSLSGDLLRPVAVEGLISPFLSGKPVRASEFFDKIPPHDALFVDSMCRALHLRNHHNIGVDKLQLYFNYDPGANCDLEKSLLEIAFMIKRLGEIGLDPTLLVCEITEAEELDPEVLQRLAAAMRGHGVGIAVDGFSVGHSTERRVELLQPDIIKIDGSWFRKLCLEPAAIRLFSQLVCGLRKRDAKVLVEGIEDDGQLIVAVDAGADLFQGYHLGRPALAGTVFDESPRTLPRLERGSGVVVSLFG